MSQLEGVFPTEMEGAKQRYFPPRRADIVLLVVSVISIIIVISVVPYGFLWSGIVVLFAAGLYVRLKTGPVYDIVFVQSFDKLDLWLHDGYYYLHPDTDASETPKTKWYKAHPPTELPDMLPHLHGLISSDTDLGILYDPKRKVDYSYLNVGSFEATSVGIEEIHNLQLRLSEMYKQLLSVAQVKVVTSSVYQVRPRNIRPYTRYLYGTLHPDVDGAYEIAAKKEAVGLELTENEKVNLKLASVRDQLIEYASYGNEVTAAIVVSAKRPGFISRALTSEEPHVDRADIHETSIWQLQNVARRQLKGMGARIVEPMTYLDLHRLQRTSWDRSNNLPLEPLDGLPIDLGQYHTWYTDTKVVQEAIRDHLNDPKAEHQPEEDKELLETLKQRLPDTIWPHMPGARIRAHAGCLEIRDGMGNTSWAGTLMAEGMPGIAAADLLEQLYIGNHAEYVSIAFIGDIDSSKRDVKRQDWVVELIRVYDDFRGKMTKSTHAQVEEAKTVTKALERELSGVSQTGKIAVSALCATRRQLRNEMEELSADMSMLSLDPYRVKRKFLQLPAVLSAWLGIDLL